MNIKLGPVGELYVERSDGYQLQLCPFTPEDSAHRTHCGSWCPLFGEPTKKGMDTFVLPLCHRELQIDAVVDERTR
jgi:hypothetical protein